MDGTRFDLWTRRRFGLAAGSALAALLVWDTPGASAKKRKKRGCVNPGAACRSSRKAKRCCGGLACDLTPGDSSRFCCRRGRQSPCGNDRECCGSDVLCTDRIGDPIFLCRGILDAACGETADCAGSLVCDDVEKRCVSAIPSDRALKANFASVDPADVLQRVRDLPISTWAYAADGPAVRRVGPMARDFAALFAVGGDDRHIHPLDGQGVALAAIQGLLARIDDLQAVNALLAARVAALEQTETAAVP